MNITENYKKEIGEIRFRADFEAETIELMKQAATRKGVNNMFSKKTGKIILVATLIIVMLSVTAFAVSSLLSAREVAEKLGESYAVDALSQNENEIQSVTDKGYTVSFLGQAEGKKLIDADGVDANCSYFVVSVAKEDGSALSLTDEIPIGISVVIEGCYPWQVNTWSLSSSSTGFEENGILYYLYECVSLEIFAHRNVFLAVYEGGVPGPEIITMNADGTLDFADNYSGFKAMFKLPLDPTKANPEVADEIIYRLTHTESEI